MIGPHYYKPTYYVGNWRNGFYKSTYSIQKKKIIFFSRPFWYFIFFENHCRRRVGDLLRRIQMLGRWILTRDSWEQPVGGHIAIAQYYSAENNGKHPAMQFKVFRIYALLHRNRVIYGRKKNQTQKFLKFPRGI